MKYHWFLVAMLLSNLLFASHNRSGRIEAEYLSGTSTYRIRIETCTKTSSTQSDRPSIDSVYLGDGSVVAMPRISFVDLPNDVRYNIYVFDHTYPGVGTYLIHFTDPNRSANIVNMTNSGNESFYLETELVITGNCPSNSPDAFIRPVAIGNIGVDLHTARSCFDYDRDSLAYSLVVPKSGVNQQVAGYFIPAGISLNLYSGEFSWDGDSIVTPGEYIFDILVEKWRISPGGNHIRLGCVMEEIQIQISTLINDSVTVNTNGFPQHVNGYYFSEILPDSILHLEISYANNPVDIDLFGNLYDSSWFQKQFRSDSVIIDYYWKCNNSHVARQPFTLVAHPFKGPDLIYMVYVLGNYNDSCLSYIGVGETEPINISVYPNPSDREIFIELMPFREAMVEIFDVQGRLAEKRKIRCKERILLDNVGLYLFRISWDGGNLIKKLLVVR